MFIFIQACNCSVLRSSLDVLCALNLMLSFSLVSPNLLPHTRHLHLHRVRHASCIQMCSTPLVQRLEAFQANACWLDFCWCFTCFCGFTIRPQTDVSMSLFSDEHTALKHSERGQFFVLCGEVHAATQLGPQTWPGQPLTAERKAVQASVSVSGSDVN